MAFDIGLSMGFAIVVVDDVTCTPIPAGLSRVPGPDTPLPFIATGSGVIST